MGVWSLCAVACAAAMLFITPRPADAAAKDRTYGTRLGSHSMLYLNHTGVEQEALIRAASEAGIRYLRMDFAVGMVFAWDRTDFSTVEHINQLAARYRVDTTGLTLTAFRSTVTRSAASRTLWWDRSSAATSEAGMRVTGTTRSRRE